MINKKGLRVEIMIVENRVRKVRGGMDAPNNPRAIEARRIAGFLSLVARRADAKIVHNVDDSYTGIRLETRSGPIIIEVPTDPEAGFRLVLEFIEPVNGRTGKQLVSYPAKRTAKAKAFLAEEYLKSRGFLG